MTLITFQDGRAVMRDGKVGTEQACCCQPPCVCPDLESLCISLTLTDYNGNVSNADQADFFWFGGVGTAFIDGFSYSVSISCADGVISVFAGWAGFIENCVCTSGGSATSYSCDGTADWYARTTLLQMPFDNIGIPCDAGCPANLGSVTVTISNPPC